MVAKDTTINFLKSHSMNEFWLKVNKTLRYHARQTVVDMRGFWWDQRRMPADRPIFVVSDSRSGTQMLYKTLSESKEIGSLQREIYAIWEKLHSPANKNWDTHALDATDASQYDRDFVTRYFYAHTGNLRFVDKNNQHGLAVPYLHALFPDATFVYIKRNPGDTLNSMIEGWGKPERFATWSTDLPENVAIDNGSYERWCHYLPDGWRDYLNSSVEDVCAFQYGAIHKAILSAKKNIPQDQWIEIFYEDVVKDSVVEIRKLFYKLGLIFNTRLEKNSANLLKKPYDPLFEIKLEKWREHRHRERIERVLPKVVDVAKEMGYEV